MLMLTGDWMWLRVLCIDTLLLLIVVYSYWEHFVCAIYPCVPFSGEGEVVLVLQKGDGRVKVICADGKSVIA